MTCQLQNANASIVSLCRDCLAEFEQTRSITCSASAAQSAWSRIQSSGCLDHRRISIAMRFMPPSKNATTQIVGRQARAHRRGQARRGINRMLRRAGKYGPRSAMPMYQSASRCAHMRWSFAPTWPSTSEASRLVRELFLISVTRHRSNPSRWTKPFSTLAEHDHAVSNAVRLQRWLLWRARVERTVRISCVDWAQL